MATTGKKTLLELTQSILDSMDSDDVNSIDDTEESLQVAGMIEDTYYDLISDKDWPHTQQTCQLNSVSDSSRPTELRIPDDVSTVENIRYNTTETGDDNTTYTPIKYVDPNDFLDRVFQLSTSASNVSSVTLGSGTIIFIRTDKMPEIWTSFDDEHIVMDPYGS